MTVFTTVIFYCCILVICTLFANIAQKKNNKKMLFPIIIILSLVAGLRHYSVGTDTQAYMLGIENFYKVREVVWPYTSFSTGYGYFTVFIYNIYHNYNFLLVVEAFIINTLIIYRFWDFRQNGSFTFMIFAYLLIVYLRTFNLNVQYLALAVVFYATRFVDENKLIKFLICVTLASLIHKSALIGLIYFVIKWFDFKKMRKIDLLIKVVTVVIGGIFIIYAYNNLYDNYSQYISTKESSVGLMVFVQLLVYIVTMLLYKHKLKDDKSFKTVSVYYLIGILLSFSSYLIANAGRISYYFMIFEPVFYSMIIKDEKKDKIFNVILVTWIIVYSIYVIVDGYTGSQYFPYSFFWM